MKVTDCDAVPAGGAVSGVVNTKWPPTEADPPVRIELARVCPIAMLLAVGNTEMVGVSLFTVTRAEPLAVV